MKLLKILFVMSFCTVGINAQTTNFKHDWDIKYREHDIQFTSNKKTPIPFSTNGEPQAIMFMGAHALEDSEKNNLIEIVNDEIAVIRKEYSIDEYLEEDFEANDNIVSYFEKLNNVEIAVIKYRINGFIGGETIMPRSVRHILFIHNDKLWISSLIVLFGEDQDNVRDDQMTFIKAILK